MFASLKISHIIAGTFRLHAPSIWHHTDFCRDSVTGCDGGASKPAAVLDFALDHETFWPYFTLQQMLCRAMLSSLALH